MNLLPQQQCTGCMLCKNICKIRAIDEVQINGFRYPTIDSTRCVNCEECIEACPVSKESAQKVHIQAFMTQSKASIDVICSSSGGFVKTLAKTTVKNGGVSYGVRFSRDFKKAFFSRAITEDEVEDQCRSKYLESLPFPYEEARRDLKAGKKVLVCGTPCQIAAVESALEDVRNDQLVTVSLICNSIPSSQKWRDWLDKTERACKSYTVYVNMRYSLNDMYIVMLNGKVIHQKQKDNEWTRSFLTSDSVIRPSCFNCKFKYPYTFGDFIVGDTWGLNKNAHGFSNQKTNVVLVMSERGKTLLDSMKESLIESELSPEEFKKLCSTNWALVRSRKHK